MESRWKGSLSDLRRRAEAAVEAGDVEPQLQPREMRVLLHELMVSQEELEIQNEQLRQERAAVTDAGGEDWSRQREEIKGRVERLVDRLESLLESR